MSKKQKKRLIRIIVALVFFIVLEILQYSGKLDALPGIVLFALYFVPYLVVGYDVLVRAFKNIVHGQVFDENFLMMIATFAAFGLGIFGDAQYAEALAVMLFYQIGELFQDYAVGKSRESITAMMDIAPESANLEKDGIIEEVDPEDVHPEDIIVVKPGEKVPLDGVVIEGKSFLDTSALTGEPVPRAVDAGDTVVSGCVNKDGTLRVRVTKEYEDSTVSQILDLVENASNKKARLENFITRFAKVYTPAVTIGAVVLAILLPLAFHMSWADGIRRACNFLIVSCPCALVISVPLGFFGGIGAASRIGVLVKGSNYLEMAAKVTTVVMDKTGTLTKGEFKVQSIHPVNGCTEERLLEYAALGEGYSDHPIAQSIRQAYGRNLDMTRIKDAREMAGHGIEAMLDDNPLFVGNGRLLAKHDIGYEEADETAGTLVYVAYNGIYQGYLVIADAVKEGVSEAIQDMKASGVEKTVMLTGDRQKTAEKIAQQIGVDEVRAELLPQDKVLEIEKIIAREGDKKTAFVGDGINDAPVLMRADVGFAMGAMGSDAAIEAADIVLMDDDIRKIPKVFRIARKTMRIVQSNVIFAIAVKILVLILSALGKASMWAAVFADVGVSVLCILNSMRALQTK